MKKTEREIVEFDIRDMVPIVITLVIFGIVAAYGLNVLDDTAEDFCEATGTTQQYSAGACYTDSNLNVTVGDAGGDFNATGDAILGTAKLPEKLPLIGTIVVAVLIIGIIIRNLAQP